MPRAINSFDQQMMEKTDTYSSITSSQFAPNLALNNFVESGKAYQTQPSDIVTNGLVFYLDAGFRNSYPQVGTIWRDVSVNRNNGTLTNGPTYSGANGGFLVFDGTNDYVLVNSFSQLPIGASARTINIWFKPNSTTWVDNIHTLFFYGTRVSAQSFGIDFSTYPVMEFFSWANDFTFSTTFTQTGWSNLTVVYNGSTNISIYENSVNTQSKTISTLNTTSTDFWLGSFNPAFSAWYYEGGIANVQIYNRAISATEVAQNFNAMRKRFGI